MLVSRLVPASHSHTLTSPPPSPENRNYGTKKQRIRQIFETDIPYLACYVEREAVDVLGVATKLLSHIVTPALHDMLLRLLALGLQMNIMFDLPWGSLAV